MSSKPTRVTKKAPASKEEPKARESKVTEPEAVKPEPEFASMKTTRPADDAPLSSWVYYGQTRGDVDAPDRTVEDLQWLTAVHEADSGI